MLLSACGTSSSGKPDVVVAAAPVALPAVEARIRSCFDRQKVGAEKAAAVPPGPWTAAQVSNIVASLGALIDNKTRCGRDLIADQDRIRAGLAGGR